ncbi:MAG: hypothetical protein V4687_02970 [Bacteroidota bacterium]
MRYLLTLLYCLSFLPTYSQHKSQLVVNINDIETNKVSVDILDFTAKKVVKSESSIVRNKTAELNMLVPHPSNYASISLVHKGKRYSSKFVLDSGWSKMKVEIGTGSTLKILNVRVPWSQELDAYNATFKLPKNFTEQPYGSNAKLGKSFLSAPSALLFSKDSAICVYVGRMQIDTTTATKIKYKRFGFSTDFNHNYIRAAISQTDTNKKAITHLPQSEVRKMFNADDVITYDVIIWKYNDFLGKYNRCTAYVIHKEDRCDISLFFFYHESTEAASLKSIRKNYRLVKFKD